MRSASATALCVILLSSVGKLWEITLERLMCNCKPGSGPHSQEPQRGDKDYIRVHYVYTVQDESGMYVRVTNHSDSKHALVDVSDTCI